ncbi:respiratory nitrate reductase subunit gamma [Nocardioides ferulae]|uniref:respiratory nitrate reductase subunit gamma n=1 Tax=Nocardioides ferulae TaxID=2340821 RepID=UPI000EB5AE63|nr:respiratory nitrate reductase subunit gamma [Nocardioides ferulae]
MNTLAFVVVPYLCLAVFVVGHVWRWRHDQMGWTTHTSQLLEGRLLRLASPLFHLGALGVVGGHVIGLLIPASWTHAVGISEHAYHVVAVGGGTVSGLMLAAGFVLLVIRRRMTPKVFRATTRTDKLLYAAMGWMILLGMTATVGVNIFGEGYDYREELAVWFRQIFWLQPESHLMADAPLVYQAHAVSGFLFMALWPFTRLVHVWSAPLAYLWRPYVVYRGRPGNAPTASRTPSDVRDSALPR